MDKQAELVLWCLLWTTHSIDGPGGDIACSLHTTQAKGEEFCKQYWSTMPKHAPSTYLSCTGEGYQCRVDQRTYKRIEDSDIGLWSVTVPQNTIEAVAFLAANDLMSLTESRMPA